MKILTQWFFVALLTIVFILSLAFAAEANARPKMLTIKYALQLNWCGHVKKDCRASREAYGVVKCETGGTFNIWASNGQYKGLFQMGSGERAKYGHGWNAWDQAKAAHKYYIASGKDWSPWQCRPDGSLAW